MYHTHKIAHQLQKTPLRFLAKLIYYLNFFLFNSAVPPEVKIGKGSRFAYGGIGVVMNKRAEIGEDCIIGQGITIGGRGQDRAGIVKIGNGVFIGAGARILGTVSVGDNAVIAPNSVVIKDVAAGTIVGGVPARFIRDGITKENQKMYV